MKTKIILFIFNLLKGLLSRLAMAVLRLLLIILFRGLTLLVSLFYMLIDVIIHLGSFVGVIITSSDGEESGFSTEPRFSDHEIIAMAKDTPSSITNIEDIASHHKVSFRQARKVKNIIKNPPVNVNTYVTA